MTHVLCVRELRRSKRPRSASLRDGVVAHAATGDATAATAHPTSAGPHHQAAPGRTEARPLLLRLRWRLRWPVAARYMVCAAWSKRSSRNAFVGSYIRDARVGQRPPTRSGQGTLGPWRWGGADATVVTASKFFGPDNFPGGPVVRQADSSRLFFFRHGDPVVSPWGSGINVVPEGSVVPLESSDIPRGAARGSVVPCGAHSHILSAAGILIRRRPTIPRAL